MTDVKLSTIGERIKYARVHRNLSQRQVAVKVGVDQKTISNMEKNAGFSTPRLEMVARVLGCEYEWVRHGIGEPPEPLDIIIPQPSKKEEIERLNETVADLKQQLGEMKDSLTRLTDIVETLVESKQPRN